MTDLRWCGREREEPNTRPRLTNTVLSTGKEMSADWVALGNLGIILGEMYRARIRKRRGPA